MILRLSAKRVSVLDLVQRKEFTEYQIVQTNAVFYAENADYVCVSIGYLPFMTTESSYIALPLIQTDFVLRNYTESDKFGYRGVRLINPILQPILLQSVSNLHLQLIGWQCHN